MSQRTIDARLAYGPLRFFLRLPIWLYRAHLGWLLGGRFLLLTHTGRKSGKLHQTVLEVVRHDKPSNTYIIASGWGTRSDWMQNITKTPEVIIQVGNQRLSARAERLSPTQAESELRTYAQQHPEAFRRLAGLMTGQPWWDGAEYYQELAQSVPMFVLCPHYFA